MRHTVTIGTFYFISIVYRIRDKSTRLYIYKTRFEFSGFYFILPYILCLMTTSPGLDPRIKKRHPRVITEMQHKYFIIILNIILKK